MKKCKFCNNEVPKKAKYCPCCNKKIKSNSGVTVLIILLFFFGFIAWMQNDMENSKTQDATFIEDVMKYSRISTEELVSMLGEPVNVSEWTNNEYLLTTYEYDINSNHYEFVTHEDAVIRLTIYSDKYWNNGNTNFTYKFKNDIPTLFGVTTNDNTKRTSTGYAISFQINTHAISELYLFDVNEDSKEFGGVKATYDPTYF